MHESLRIYLLRLGDTALIHGQRLSELCGHAPSVEEDIALANIALDHIGQARYLLSLVGDEDELAYFRDEREFRNMSLVELDNGDFAQTILKLFLVSSYQIILWRYLQDSSLLSLAAIAEKSLKEAKYHQEYSASWVIKLGDGSVISHDKMQSALNTLSPYVAELFESDAVEHACYQDQICPLSQDLYFEFEQLILSVIKTATLIMPAVSVFRSTGKQGIHTEYLGEILTKMQFLQRSYPDGNW